MNLSSFQICTHIIIKYIIKTLSLYIQVTVINTGLMVLDEDAWACRECVDVTIETDALCQNYTHAEGAIRGIVDLMVDFLTSFREKMVIGGEEQSTNVVKDRLMKLTRFHIDDVIDNWNKLAELPINPRQYLLAMLYNVSTTADFQFTAVLNRDARSNFRDSKEADNTAYYKYIEG